MKIKAGIIGVSGYTGLELFKLLELHPNIGELHLFSSSKVDCPLNKVYPHIFTKHRLKKIDMNFISTLDILFLAVPSGVSSAYIEELAKTRIRIIDLSGDLRLKRLEERVHYYNNNNKEIQKIIENQVVYGICEYNKQEIQKAQIISNCGCYAIATILALTPLYLKKGIVETNSIVVDGKSGVSGTGKNPSNINIYGQINENISIYKVGKHQHVPEIEQHLSKCSLNGVERVSPLTFSTHLIPMMRGIMITSYLKLEQDTSLEEIHSIYAQQYANDKFVRIRSLGNFAQTKEVLGTNFCDISIGKDERSKRLIITSVIDNLIKGASGNAVQNMNLMFKFAEDAGLKLAGFYP